VPLARNGSLSQKGADLTSFIVISASGEQQLVASRKNRLRIGRFADSEIFIGESMVSRKHAEIYRADGKYYVQDVGSSNGTFLNGRRLTQPTEFSPGDTIAVGSTKIVYEGSEDMSFLKNQNGAELTAMVNLAAPPSPGEIMAPLVLLETIAEIARQIVQDRPLEQLLDAILRICVDKTHAERAAIMLLDEKGDLVPRAYLSKARSYNKFAISKSIANKAIAQNQAILLKDVAGDETLNMTESILGLMIRSAICTPMWNGEKTVGVLYVDTTAPDRLFGEIDLLFFSTLSLMIAEKIENAVLEEIAKDKRRLDAELEIASEIQVRLFPLEMPQIEGYELSAVNYPCTEVGGDYFDVIALRDTIGIAVADVTGKGIGAAILMSNLQALLQARATEYRDPAELLKKLNTDLTGRVGDDKFITFFYLLLQPKKGKVLYANAGHNRPLLRRRSGEIFALEVSGVPLGIFDASTYEKFKVKLEPGDVLTLYSDGITECNNSAGELFGEERLKEVLGRCVESDTYGIRKAIFSAVDDFRQGEPYADDMTLVVLKRMG
jgi:phosphoserine phosphatase RsbU/P